MRPIYFCLIICLGYPFSEAVQKLGRIIGGEIVRSGQYPFAAAIYTSTANGRYFCGGTLLNNEWILTAGQCVDGVQTFDILLGTTRLNGDDPYATRVSSDTYVLHPDYDSATLNNDIGLIHLRVPVELNDYIQPIDSLPYGNSGDYNNDVAIGWGQTSDDESGLSEELRFVDVTVVPNQECKLTYGDQITENMVCVEGNYNEGTCFGDAGSPLVDTYIGNHHSISGVSSFFSANGCESTDPSGFTRVYPYNTWIRNITGAK